jgi:hypothetical protein
VFGKSTATVPDPVQTSEPVNLEGPIVLDLGEVRDEPVTIGWHVVTIERAEAGVTRQKGLPKIFVLSRVTDEGDVEYNRTIIWNVMLSGDGMVFTKRCLVALGLPTQLNYPSYQALADDLIGREVEVKVKHRVYQGEKQVQISNWKALTPEISF